MTTRVYSIRDLEHITGLRRTTIYFYLRQGLLPQPQKTAASRSLYTEEHVKILAAISVLKAEGHTLAEISDELRVRVAAANRSMVDLAAQEHRRTHARIITLATAEFAANGYRNTHVAGIMRKLGITATAFYSHFPSKRRLLAECAASLMDWSGEFADRRLEQTSDPAEGILWNLFAHDQAFALGSAALALVRVEGEGPEDDEWLEDALVTTLQKEVERIRIALERGLEGRTDTPYPVSSGLEPSNFPAELLALELFAAFQPLALRPPNERYGPEKLLEAHLWLFLAAQAAFRGEIDVDSRLARYKDLIDRLASEPPPPPPGPAGPLPASS